MDIEKNMNKIKKLQLINWIYLKKFPFNTYQLIITFFVFGRLFFLDHYCLFRWINQINDTYQNLQIQNTSSEIYTILIQYNLK